MAMMRPVKRTTEKVDLSPVLSLAEAKQDMPVVPFTLVDKYLRQARGLTRLNISGYGTDVSASVAKLSDDTLEKTKVSEISDFSDGLSKIILLTSQVDFSKLGGGDKVDGFFGKLKAMFAESKEKIVARATSVEDRIKEIAEFLEKRIQSMETRNLNLEDLFKMNMEEYQNLEAAIRALERVEVDEKGKLEKMQANSGDVNLGMLQQSDQIDFVTKIEIRLDYLRKMQHLALLTVPEIRRSQNNNINMIDKFNTIKTITLPAWRKQLRLIIEGLEQKKDATVANSVDDQTNDFLKKSADLAGQNYVAVTKASQRSVVDTSTLQHMTDALVSSTKEAQAIIESAKTERVESMKEIEKMRTQLKETFNPMKRVGSAA